MEPQEPSKPLLRSAPETFLFTSRVVGYFDPSLSTRRVFLVVQDKHGGGDFLYLVGNYPYSYPLVPPLVISLLFTYFYCLGQPLRTATYPPCLPLLLTLRRYLNNTFIQLLFDSLSEYRYAWQLSPSTTLSLSLPLSVSVCLLPVCGQLKPQRINL